MSKRAITITGAGELADKLSRLGREMTDLSQPAKESAELLAADVRRRVPVRTGRLRSTVAVTGTTPSSSSVTIGARYARPVLARRNVLSESLRVTEESITPTFDNTIAALVRQTGL